MWDRVNIICRKKSQNNPWTSAMTLWPRSLKIGVMNVFHESQEMKAATNSNLDFASRGSHRLADPFVVCGAADFTFYRLHKLLALDSIFQKRLVQVHGHWLRPGTRERRLDCKCFFQTSAILLKCYLKLKWKRYRTRRRLYHILKRNRALRVWLHLIRCCAIFPPSLLLLLGFFF